MYSHEILSVLSEFTYKPGWEFEFTGEKLRVRMNVVDADNPRQMILTGMTRNLNYHTMTEAEFVDWLWETVRRCEHHEQAEWFRLRGTKMWDQHANQDELDTLAL